ncbi:LOW QUALITY PROTEIN: uncharacterized protein syt15 [Phycodurus eques]|uniref:LOW QUALITY PROTEIN: uncharacterized protein syt15 n=1 Tax=Phycodurus eques TaxID=693459 RepID=UPI002ACE6398|nr:LOW QUALITY PROTEIN: uncharacterized protein syt15 [Phycodurus eques]
MVPVGLAAGRLVLLLFLLVLLGLVMLCLCRSKWRRDRRRYQQPVAAAPRIPACTAPVVPVLQGSHAKSVPLSPGEIPFTLPPRFTTSQSDAEVMKTEARRDILAHRGSLFVQRPFMYARGLQLQHWMDMVNTPHQEVKMWHGLCTAA